MRLIVLLTCLLTAACGDATPYDLAGPSAVVPPLPAEFSVSGKWGGAVAVTIQGQHLSAPVAMSLDHQGTVIAGWWSALAVAGNAILVGQDVGGDIQGTVTAGRFAGTVTWVSNDGQCYGSASLSGPITRGRLSLSASNIPLANCSAPSAFLLDVVPR